MQRLRLHTFNIRFLTQVSPIPYNDLNSFSKLELPMLDLGIITFHGSTILHNLEQGLLTDFTLTVYLCLSDNFTWNMLIKHLCKAWNKKYSLILMYKLRSSCVPLVIRVTQVEYHCFGTIEKVILIYSFFEKISMNS